jgi:hypothetical protein
MDLVRMDANPSPNAPQRQAHTLRTGCWAASRPKTSQSPRTSGPRVKRFYEDLVEVEAGNADAERRPITIRVPFQAGCPETSQLVPTRPKSSRAVSPANASATSAASSWRGA